MHRCVGAFEPAVELYELILIEPPGSDGLERGGNAGDRVVDKPETAREALR
jgi:hypothetical protein